jgi:hypothetical protein
VDFDLNWYWEGPSDGSRWRVRTELAAIHFEQSGSAAKGDHFAVPMVEVLYLMVALVSESHSYSVVIGC